MSSIDVIKRDGSIQEFDADKLSDSIMNAALAVGGEDYDLADEIANKILDILESNEISEISAEELQDIVEKTLIEDGHAATSKEYILKAADRNRMREMDTALMKSYEEITFKSEADSEIKRENANIDSSTSMGVMLKYGSEGAKNFNLLYMMSKDIAEAHKNGDIHIHDLDFLTLTETCIANDTMLTVKIDDIEKVLTAEELFNIYNVDKVDSWVNVDNLQISSDGKFVKVKGLVKHNSDRKQMLEIKTSTKVLKVTDEHKVTVIDGDTRKDVVASELKVGDKLIVVDNSDNNEITSIEKVDYTGFVYDLETENHHFDANSILVHNCMQIPLDKLFEGGFNTGHGFLRSPGGIRAASAQAAIAIQSDQNDQHKLVA